MSDDTAEIKPSEVHVNDRIWALEHAVTWAEQVGEYQAKAFLQTMLKEARQSSLQGVIFA